MCGNHVRRAVRTLTCVRQKTVLTRSHISKGDMQKAKPLNLCHVVRAETMYFIQVQVSRVQPRRVVCDTVTVIDSLSVCCARAHLRCAPRRAGVCPLFNPHQQQKGNSTRCASKK